MAELSPLELWVQAGGGTPSYSRERYRELMREHGHLIALQPGEKRGPLPCGWPDRRIPEPCGCTPPLPRNVTGTTWMTTRASNGEPMSETVVNLVSPKPTVFEALSAAMAEVQAVGKDSRNTEQGYNFRGIDAVVNAVGPVLKKHGVIVLPEVLEATFRDVRTTKDKPARECTVKVRYRFYGPAGDFIDAVVPGESLDFSDKGAAKAMSVAYRIVLLQALCIPTDEADPDSQALERSNEGAGSPEAIELFAAVMDAKTKSQLRAAWEAVRDARAEGRINEREAVQLNNHVKRRQSEVTDDSAADTQRGGDPTVPDGPGVGDDGEPARGGGPGRDEEAGGVRPGVQPGVHRGDGSGGAAKAPGRDRGAPAAVGGRRE